MTAQVPQISALFLCLVSDYRAETFQSVIDRHRDAKAAINPEVSSPGSAAAGPCCPWTQHSVESQGGVGSSKGSSLGYSKSLTTDLQFNFSPPSLGDTLGEAASGTQNMKLQKVGLRIWETSVPHPV